MKTRHRLALVVVSGMLVFGRLSGSAAAQSSKSAGLAKELTQLLDGAKLTSVAAKDPEEEDRFVGALYFPGRQLLVISAKYSAPVYINEQLVEKNYQGVYTDLQSASVPESKVFIDDLLADGLMARPAENAPFDTATLPASSTSFNGDWRAQKMSEDQYGKAFQEADDHYARMLTILVAELKKAS
jgi:hypothetical protein